MPSNRQSRHQNRGGPYSGPSNRNRDNQNRQGQGNNNNNNNNNNNGFNVQQNGQSSRNNKNNNNNNNGPNAQQNRQFNRNNNNNNNNNNSGNPGNGPRHQGNNGNPPQFFCTEHGSNRSHNTDTCTRVNNNNNQQGATQGNRPNNGNGSNNNNRSNQDNRPQNSRRTACEGCGSEIHNTFQCNADKCSHCLMLGHSLAGCSMRKYYPPMPRANGQCAFCPRKYHELIGCWILHTDMVAGSNARQDASPAMASTQAAEGQASAYVCTRPGFRSQNPQAVLNPRMFNENIFAASTSSVQSFQRSTCGICTADNHQTIDCERTYPCTNCGSPFHPRSACDAVIGGQSSLRQKVTKYEPNNASVYCVYCNNVAHSTEMCNDIAQQEIHRLSNVRCGQCQKPGHRDEDCQNPVAQWRGPLTFAGLPEQDWQAAWSAGFKPCCNKCQYAMEVLEEGNGDFDCAMGGTVSGKLVIPSHPTCRNGVIFWAYEPQDS
ncbi:MAG: hypothetical protein M1820_010520 [Bogoriella megaspora]|nr:MAG: hypothetical protein M1820_010520 [Bogoriella megaspora]